MSRRGPLRLIPAMALALAVSGWAQGQPAEAVKNGSCFLLQELGAGAARSEQTGDVCAIRVTPASTFKIPHALAALDAGVLADENEVLRYDGADLPFDSWKKDHSLATAIRYSVVWFFQRIAERLGMDRERDYLRRFDFGNADPSSALTTFWLGGSLRVSPLEELRFLKRLYRRELPVSDRAMSIVQRILVQPRDSVVNALGVRPFRAPWPDGTTLSAKTGSARDASGSQVRWLVGHVERDGREWVFVSCVVGDDDLSPSAAIDLAASSLHGAGAL